MLHKVSSDKETVGLEYKAMKLEVTKLFKALSTPNAKPTIL